MIQSPKLALNLIRTLKTKRTEELFPLSLSPIISLFLLARIDEENNPIFVEETVLLI